METLGISTKWTEKEKREREAKRNEHMDLTYTLCEKLTTEKLPLYMVVDRWFSFYSLFTKSGLNRPQKPRVIRYS